MNLHDESERHLTVLLVDDHEPTRTVLELFLTSNGFNVRAAVDGIHALELVSNDIDIVVTDYQMPRMNGIELLERLETEWPGLPVVLTSASNPGELRALKPANIVVQKPSEVGALPDIIRRVAAWRK